MDDSRIIELYFARDERAIEETRLKYGKLVRYVAKGILRSDPDVEECESDTYLHVWDSIPPVRPMNFTAYIAKVSRNISLNRLRNEKRHMPPESVALLDEISEMLPDVQGEITESIMLRDALTDFIGQLEPTKRKIFVKRYFYMRSYREISIEMGIGMGTVKSLLSRMREQLRDYLTKRGIVI